MYVIYNKDSDEALMIAKPGGKTFVVRGWSPRRHFALHLYPNTVPSGTEGDYVGNIDENVLFRTKRSGQKMLNKIRKEYPGVTLELVKVEPVSLFKLDI